MVWKYQNLFALNTVVVGVCYVIYTVVLERYNEKIYKKTTIFREAMDILKSHKGAVHYLGEFIEDGKLRVMNEEKVDDKTTYHVKVAVSGTDGKGNMYFWLSRKDEDSDAQLNRIELKLMNMKKRLLILDRNNSEAAADVPVKS